MTHARQLSKHFLPLTTRMVITIKPRFTDTRLIRTPRCLVPRGLSFDENVRAKEGGKETTGFACRLYPSHGPLLFISSHSRFALASAKRKTKRLKRRRTPRYYGQFPLSLGKESRYMFSKLSSLLKYGHPLIRTTDTYSCPINRFF